MRSDPVYPTGQRSEGLNRSKRRERRGIASFVSFVIFCGLTGSFRVLTWISFRLFRILRGYLPSVGNKHILTAAAAIVIAAIVFLGIRVFQPPVSLAKLDAVRPGMSPSQVRESLGPPTRVYPGLSYAVHGTNYQTEGQWTYQRFLTSGYVNVLFDTNGTVEYGHYEPF